MITIYKITNTVNGMVYVGQTSMDIRRRLNGHKSAAKDKYTSFKLQKAMNEYGKDKFVIEPIDAAETKEEADEKEVLWIQRLDSIENGYNSAKGGKDNGRRKKIMNIETGEVFESAVEAAKAMGVSPQAIRQAVNSQKFTCCGSHWQQLEKK